MILHNRFLKWEEYQVIKRGKVFRIETNIQWVNNPRQFLLYQLTGVVMFVIGIVLSLPYVPGPGWAFIIIALLLTSYPGKNSFISWIRGKRWFRYLRVYLKKKANILLILPTVHSTRQPISERNKESWVDVQNGITKKTKPSSAKAVMVVAKQGGGVHRVQIVKGKDAWPVANARHVPNATAQAKVGSSVAENVKGPVVCCANNNPLMRQPNPSQLHHKRV